MSKKLVVDILVHDGEGTYLAGTTRMITQDKATVGDLLLNPVFEMEMKFAARWMQEQYKVGRFTHEELVDSLKQMADKAER